MKQNSWVRLLTYITGLVNQELRVLSVRLRKESLSYFSGKTGDAENGAPQGARFRDSNPALPSNASHRWLRRLIRLDRQR
jgi:hypothetical protein